MKKCSMCKREKNISEFHRCNKTKDKLQAFCKKCSSECSKKFKKTEKRKSWERKYRQREKVKAYRSVYHKIYIKKWHKNKLLTDLKYRLAYILRKRLNMALKRNQKSGSAVRDLGCTIPELKIYLENQFQEGMNWDNYGKGEGKWNIDHRIPLYNFDLTERGHFLKAVHYTNLQPMWAINNMSKNKFII